MAAVGWVVVQVFARWLEKSLFQVCFYSLPSILRQLAIFVEHVENMPCSSVIFLSIHRFLNLRAQRIVWGHCVFLIYSLMPNLVPRVFSLALGAGKSQGKGPGNEVVWHTGQGQTLQASPHPVLGAFRCHRNRYKTCPLHTTSHHVLFFQSRLYDAVQQMQRPIYRRDITQQHIDQPTAVSDHFTLPAHSMDNIELIPLEFITSNRDAIRKARESFLISKGQDPWILWIKQAWRNLKFLFFYTYPFWYKFKFSLFLSTYHVTYISFSIIKIL